jgi:hypothetical protein
MLSDPPWKVGNNSAAVFGSIDQAGISYLKATGPNGITRAFEVVEYATTSNHERIASGVHLLVHNNATNGSSIDVWDTGILEIGCEPSASRTTRYREIPVSTFDSLENAPLELTEGTWSSCDSVLPGRSSSIVQIGKGPLPAAIAGAIALPVGTDSESKTVSILDLPWPFQGGSSVRAAFTVFRATYIRAIDPASGTPVYYMTLEYQATSNRWILQTGGNMKIISQNAQSGALDEWNAGPPQIGCFGTNGIRVLPRQISPDTYNQVNHAYVEVAAAQWVSPTGSCGNP